MEPSDALKTIPGRGHIFSQKSNQVDQRCDRLVDFSPALMWGTREDGQFDFFNSTWLAYTGRDLREERGMGWTQGVHPEDLAACIESFRNAFEQRCSFQIEFRLRRRDGSFGWLLSRANPKFSLDQDFRGFSGVCVDISELRFREERLRRDVDLREDFLSVAAHELKTPLTALSLQMDVFHHLIGRRDSGAVDMSRVPAVLEVSKRQVRRLAELINGLLDVSRIGQGKFTLECYDFDLHDCLRECVDRVRLLESEREVILQIEEPVRGYWDRARLEQVFANLLSNALKYGEGKAVRVSLQARDRSAWVSFEDSGSGISPEDQKRIFEKFYRGTRTKGIGGLGLGLFIVKEIVEAHRGRITCESQVGKGSTFRVELPLP